MLVILVAAAGFAVIGCGKGKASVTMAGSTAFQPFAEKLADEYMKTDKNVNITVQGGGSAVGIQAANSGAAQIGMADLVELPADAKSLTATVVAKDGVAIIVNPKNPVENITTDQIRDIFNGKITNWKELGGPDAKITVVSREAGSGTRSSFEKIIKDINLLKGALIQDSNGTIRETVANDVNSIGYLSHGLINEKIKALKVDGVESNEKEIIAGNYKLVRPIFLLVKGELQGEIKKFIDYILSAEGQQIIKSNGLLPAK
ncbi:MAG: phosphate ABC transporter substrate-binding protein [Syntrophothermus sp.]